MGKGGGRGSGHFQAGLHILTMRGGGGVMGEGREKEVREFCVSVACFASFF